MIKVFYSSSSIPSFVVDKDKYINSLSALLADVLSSPVSFLIDESLTGFRFSFDSQSLPFFKLQSAITLLKLHFVN